MNNNKYERDRARSVAADTLDKARQCGDKRRYSTKQEAKRHKRSIAAEEGRAMNVYLCPHCAGYHVGGRYAWERPQRGSGP